MMAGQVRRLGSALLVGFAVVVGGLGFWQVVAAESLNTRPDNPAVLAALRSQPRGTIFDATGVALARTTVANGLAQRAYSDPAFAHLVGYASLRYGLSGIEAAWDDVLNGFTDPNPLHQWLNDILGRPPTQYDLTLTLDRRLQDYAAAQLGTSVGAIVAIDPATGQVLAMTSTPSFDASGFTGDPGSAAAAWDLIAAQPNDPFVDRARNGVYVPGSIMKVATAAIGLDSGAVTTDTTFPTQPEEEINGMYVDGFLITEHDLNGLTPGLWDMSEAMQVSSNIYFAHVGLEIGQERYLSGAEALGFCAPWRIGPRDHGLSGVASSVTELTDAGCGPFVDDAELASASFGQGRVTASPLMMALLTAAVANGGVLPDPFVVRDIRPASAQNGPLDEIVESFAPGDGTRVMSAQTADSVRALMVDAVHGPLGAPYAGAANVALYGISGVETAGKTGTAQRGGNLPPHSWFIGFVPAGPDGSPAIAVAVIVEGAGPGSQSAAPIGGRVMAEWLRLAGGG